MRVAAALLQCLVQRIAPRLILGDDRHRQCAHVVQRVRRRMLDRHRHTVAHVGAVGEQRVQCIAATHHEAHAHAGHVERLGAGVELDRHIPATRYLKHTRRDMPVECEFGVREVVHQHQVVRTRELHERRHVRQRRHGAGGIVGIVGDQHACALQHIGRDAGQVQLPAARRIHGHHVHLGAMHQRRAHVHRITERRGQHHVTRAAERRQHLGNAFLRAGQHDGLRRRRELDAEAHRHEVRRRLQQSCAAPERRIGVGRAVQRRLAKGLDNGRRCRLVRAADAEVQERMPCGTSRDLATFQFREDVRWNGCKGRQDVHGHGFDGEGSPRRVLRVADMMND